MDKTISAGKGNKSSEEDTQDTLSKGESKK